METRFVISSGRPCRSHAQTDKHDIKYVTTIGAGVGNIISLQLSSHAKRYCKSRNCLILLSFIKKQISQSRDSIMQQVAINSFLFLQSNVFLQAQRGHL